MIYTTILQNIMIIDLDPYEPFKIIDLEELNFVLPQ